jgi:predicted dehydrogenase
VSAARAGSVAPLGVGVVGLGIGAEHARAYAETDGCALRWLYDLEPARADSLVGELGQGARAERYEAMLEDPAVSIVSIASYDEAHCAQVVAAARARKHIFVEKPLCRSEGELALIMAAWREAGAPHLASNLVLRAAPLYRWLRAAIAGGELGTVYAFDGDYLYGRLHKITDGWRSATPDYSVMQGGGVHLVDLMLWLTAQTPVSVTAVGNRLCTTATAFRYDDYAVATFQFPSGMIGRISANFGCVHRHQHVVRVFGTEATFIYDDQGARLYRGRDPGSAARPIELAPLPPAKGALIPPFVAGIAGAEDTRADTLHDFSVIRACLAADRARLAGVAMPIES